MSHTEDKFFKRIEERLDHLIETNEEIRRMVSVIQEGLEK